MIGNFKSRRERRIFVQTTIEEKGKNTSGYVVTATPANSAVRTIWRVAKTFPRPLDVYTVYINEYNILTCECLGFMHTGQCKHVGMIAALAIGFSPALESVQVSQHLNQPASLCGHCANVGVVPTGTGEVVPCPECQMAKTNP